MEWHHAAMDKRHQNFFGEICVGLNLGKQKKIWNKGFDDMMAGYSHESSVGVCGMCNLNTGKTHNTRNVQWMGKMHKECVKEDAVKCGRQFKLRQHKGQEERE